MSRDLLLEGLNDAQKQAVLHSDGPLLIVAGAGSGKTRVLTHRIARLIRDGALPERILAITFTNKAAGEMKDRVAKLLERRATAPWIGTFHALGAWLLRQEAKAAGIDPHFSIIDDDDRISLVKDCVSELGLDPKQFAASKIKRIISSKKTSLLTPDEHLAEAKDGFSRDFGKLWYLYESKLVASGVLDFDDLLVRALNLLKTNANVLTKYQTLWNYVHIDEYQDTDAVQYQIANLLAQKHSNLCVVGDVDQAIYSFRGADFRNILTFEIDWPRATVITLEENYRSAKPILDAANAVIEKNVFRKPKNLFTRADGDSKKIGVLVAENESQEADWIALRTQSLIKKGANPASIAVLFRTNAQSRALEEKFLAWRIPYHVVGVKFYARREIKDILAYLRVALNPKDLVSTKRIINTPRREIGKTLLAKYLSKRDLSPSEARKIAEFEGLLADIRAHAKQKPLSQTLETILKRTGYLDLFSPSVEDDLMRLTNIKELVGLSRRFDLLEPPKGALTLLEEAALMTGEDSMFDARSSVPLTTIHAAKGLEFDTVFISGLEDGLFPHTTLAGEEEKFRLEEERRLFYVAITRARKRVFLTLAQFRTIFGERQVNMPSRFLEDIPQELTEPMENDQEEEVIEI